MSTQQLYIFEEPHTTRILKEMCSRVGADFEKMDFTKPNWYWDYEWTEEQEDDFINWLAKYLYSYKLAHRGWYRGQKYNVHQAQKLVSNYGWKLKKGT